MNSIPPDIYDRVHELAVAMTNAVTANDEPLQNSLYATLLVFYEEQMQQGRSHPFLTEAVADYTDAPAVAIRYYELALEQARSFPSEPRHTKMISLAENLIGLGRIEEAEAYLRDGRAEAVRRNDSFWVEDADRLLLELSS